MHKKYLTIFLLMILIVLSTIKYHRKIIHGLEFYTGLFIRISDNNKENKIAQFIKSFPYIAHAGGSIDGNTYTNSYEATMNSIKKGFNLIEFDLHKLTDGNIVAFHDLSNEMNDKYTPMNIDSINNIFIKNKNLILVTDKIEDMKSLSSSIIFDKQRVVVEVFDIIHYNRAIKYGFNNVAFNIKPYRAGTIKFLKKNKISVVTYELSKDYYKTKAFKNSKELSNMVEISNLGIQSLISSFSDNLDLEYLKDSLKVENCALYYN